MDNGGPTRRELLRTASILPLGISLPYLDDSSAPSSGNQPFASHQRGTRVSVDDPLITIGHGNPLFHDANNWPTLGRETTFRQLRNLHPQFYNQRRIIGQKGPPFYTGIPASHRNGIDAGAEMGLPTTSALHWLSLAGPTEDRPVEGQLSGWLASLPDNEQWVAPDGTVANDPIEATTKRHLDGTLARSRGEAYAFSMFSPNTLEYAVLQGSQSILWGANAVTMDGAKRPLMNGGDFSEWATQAFQDHLQNLSQARRAELDIDDPESFDIRAYAREIDARIRNGESPDIAVTDHILFEFYLMQHVQLLRFYDEFGTGLEETAADVNSPISVLGNQFGGPYGDDTNASILLSRVFDVIEVEGPITVPDHPRKAQPHQHSYGAAIQSPRRKLTAACGRAQDKPVVEHGFFHTRGAAEKDRSLETGRPYPTLVGLNIAETYANGSRRQLDLTGWSDQAPDGVAAVWIDPETGEIPPKLRDFADFLWLYEEELRGTPAAQVGIVHSIPTLLATARSVFGTDLVSERTSLYGFVRALREAAIPSEYVIFGYPGLWDDTDALQRLSDYDALVCPGMSAVTDAQFEALKAFIEQGGRILHSGAVATRDRLYRLRDRQLPSAGLVDTGEEARAAAPDGDIRPLVDAIDEALSSRQVTLDADYPLTAEVTRTEESLIVHLLNYDYELEADSVTPRSDVEVRVRLDGFEPQAARIVAPGVEPVRTDFQRQDGHVEMTVPRIEVWTMVVLDESPRPAASRPTEAIDAAVGAIESARSENRTHGLIEAEATLREARLAADARQFERAKERAKTAESVATSASAVPVIGVDTGHGQGGDFGFEIFENFQESLAPDLRIELEEITEYTTEQLSTVDVLLVPPPLRYKQERYEASRDEIASVRQFIQPGGGLAVFTRAGVDPGVNELLEHFGISIDPETPGTGDGHSADVEVADYRTPLTYQLPPLESFRIVNTMDTDGTDVTVHIQTSDEDIDQPPHPILATTESGDGRVCCLTTTTPLSGELHETDFVLARNILRWTVTGERPTPEATPTSGQTTTSRRTPTPDQTTDTDSPDASAPGFGFGAALVGLVTTGLILLKRVLNQEEEQ